jgi:hypothetical protein
MMGWYMNNELEIYVRKRSWPNLKQYRHFSQGTKENRHKYKSVSQCWSRDLNLAPPLYEGEYLTFLIAIFGLCVRLAAKPEGAESCHSLRFWTTYKFKDEKFNTVENQMRPDPPPPNTRFIYFWYIFLILSKYTCNGQIIVGGFGTYMLASAALASAQMVVISDSS